MKLRRQQHFLKIISLFLIIAINTSFVSASSICSINEDNQKFSISDGINVTINNVSCNKGDVVNISANFVDSNDNPLANYNLTFTINGDPNEYNVTTDSNGTAILTYNVNQGPGIYEINVAEQGNGITACSKMNSTGILTVGKTILSIEPNSAGNTGDITNITARLTDSKGNPLKNKDVGVNIAGDDNSYNSISDENGIVHLKFPRNSSGYKIEQSNGTYEIRMEFSGDTDYLSSYNASILTVGGSNISASDIYVDTEGNDAWDGLNSVWNGTSGPKKTIKSAVNRINSGGTIHISSGIYNETGIQIDKKITIEGDNKNNTLIQGSSEVVFSASNDFTVKDLSFTNGKTNACGSIIFSSESCKIIDCNFYNNKALYGGAIYNNGNLTLINCNLSNNSAGEGGAIYNFNDGSVNIMNSTLNDNLAVGGGVIFNTGSLNIDDSVFNSNKASYGGVIYTTGSVLAENSTFSNNHVSHKDPVVHGDWENIDCILINNEVDSSKFSEILAGLGIAVVGLIILEIIFTC